MSGKRIVLVLVIALLGIVVGGWLWLSYGAAGFSARAQPSSLETLVARQARGFAVPSDAKNLKNPVAYSDDVLTEARAHWADHCAFCHANNGSGDTEVGRNLYPKAPDMRKAATQAMSDGELYYTIENGVRLTGMPAWGTGTKNDEDSWKLVYFIRHLPQMNAQEEQLMEGMNPKTPEELKEDLQEEEFLNGGVPPKKNPKAHHH